MFRLYLNCSVNAKLKIFAGPSALGVLRAKIETSKNREIEKSKSSLSSLASLISSTLAFTNGIKVFYCYCLVCSCLYC